MSLIIEAPKPLVRLTAAIERRLSIVFFGTPGFAVPSLRLLHEEGWPVKAAVTAPDKPFGRKQVMTASPVRSAAEQLGIPVYTPSTLKDDAFFAEFDALKPDLCVVVAYGKILPDRYISVPRLGFVNVHPSLLPAYRGPSPIQSAILDGCSATGVSIMLLDAEMDHGPILASAPWVIPGGFDAQLCEDELSRFGARLLADTLIEYAKGTVSPLPQNHEHATYCKKFSRQDGCIDWNRSASEVMNRVRALAANPGTWTTWGQKTLNIHHAHVHEDSPSSSPPGTVGMRDAELIVACGSGSIALEVVQLEGSTRQIARDFINGHPSFVGAILGS